jgi:hypothetical protein
MTLPSKEPQNLSRSGELQKLSRSGFARYAAGWPTASPDYISLSQYSISELVWGTDKIQGIGLAFYLRAAALKREHDGASRFIFWSFADAPPPIESEDSKEPLHGIGAPNSESFQVWLANKKSGASVEVPTWDLPVLADYADEFLHLAEDLRSLSLEFSLRFKHGIEGVFLGEALSHFVFFECWEKLLLLAREVLTKAADQHQENPVDLLLQAFESIGLATRGTLPSEARIKHQSFREAPRSEIKPKERSAGSADEW